MINYHLFIVSPPHTSESELAFTTAKKLLNEGNALRQIFFYYEGVRHWQYPNKMREWLELTKNVRLCLTYLEKYHLNFIDQPGVCVAGLVDFFAIHWQDQGVILEF